MKPTNSSSKGYKPLTTDKSKNQDASKTPGAKIYVGGSSQTESAVSYLEPEANHSQKRKRGGKKIRMQK